MHAPLPSEGAPLPLSDVARECGIEVASLRILLNIFSTHVAGTEKGNNVEFMKRSIRTFMDRDPSFRYPLRQNVVTKLVQTLRAAGYIDAREYPKTREKPLIEGRVFLTEQRVFDIIAGRKKLFIRRIRTNQGLDEGFHAFALAYNARHPEEYFPMKWKSLSENVKNKIKDLFHFGKGNIRALDTGGLRFSPAKDILASTVFREFIISAIQEGRKQGIYDFRLIMRRSLSFWYHHMRTRTRLRVPVTYIARRGVHSTFVLHLSISDPSPENVLIALDIDPAIWRKKRPKNLPTQSFDDYFDPEVFSRHLRGDISRASELPESSDAGGETPTERADEGVQ